jgi:hypothetical protein
MSDTSGIPEGFAPLTDPTSGSPDITVLEAERFLDGSIVIYHGLKEWTSARGDRHRAHAIQSEEDADSDALLGIWSTAVLDRLFAQVKSGDRVFVRYEGFSQHPVNKGKAMHQWTVARALSASTNGVSSATGET